jgi:hypothetical protein
MPRTIAADCAGEDPAAPAVWWTTALRSIGAYSGSSRRIRSFAPQLLREMIFGEPAIWRARSRIDSSGLQTKCPRTRWTRPRVRTCTRSAVPVHHGLPIRQPRMRRASSVPRSGRSSGSASASCQPLQPFAPRTRKRTRPGPRQWRPTRLNRVDGSAEASVRARPTGSSRVTSVASPQAVAGKASATSAAASNFIRDPNLGSHREAVPARALDTILTP